MVNLVAWWKCDETAGTTLADSTGNGRTLTVSGTATLGATAISNNTVGTNASIDLVTAARCVYAGDATLRGLTQWTLGAWVNMDTWVNDSFFVGSQFSGGRINFGLIHNRDSTWGNAKFGAGFYDGAWREVYYNTALTASTTYFLAATYDGTTVTLYVDGTSVNSGTPGGTNGASSGATYVGRYWVADSNHLDGRLDDIVIFDGALSAGDIASLYADMDYASGFIVAPPVPPKVPYPGRGRQAIVRSSSM